MRSSIASAAIGVWLMAAPAILGYAGPAATSDRIAGPLTAAFSIIGCWQVTRGVRRLNLAVAAWLLAAPWVLGYPLIPAVSSVLSGLMLAALAMTGFESASGIGGGWRVLWREES